MTPLEELQAAHKRLSELRDADVTAAYPDEDTSTLFEMLHRTIDAQLAILAEAMEDHGGVFVGDCPYPSRAITLARAINGDE